MSFVDPALTPDLGRRFARLEERDNQTDRAPQLISQAVPSEPLVTRSGRWLQTSNTAWTDLASSSVTLTAPWLHYKLSFDTSLLVAFTSLDWRLRASIPYPSTTVTLVTSAEVGSGSAEDSVDVMAALTNGLIYYGQTLTVTLEGRRVGGSGSIQVSYDTNLLLRAVE